MLFRSAAPNWQEKELAAEFAAEEARHSRGLYDLLIDLGEDPEEIIAGRPDAEEFWGLNLDNWLDIAVFNFTVDRAGSHQIMEYRESSYVPWGASQEEVLEDEEDHYDNGVENLKQFAKDPKQLAAFQEIYDRVMPNCLKRALHPWVTCRRHNQMWRRKPISTWLKNRKPILRRAIFFRSFWRNAGRKNSHFLRSLFIDP